MFDTIFSVVDLRIEHSNRNQHPDDVISSKNNQASENQGKDALNDSTKNQASEKNIHNDLEGSNNKDNKAAKKKVLLDDATSDKSYQKINQA